MEKKLEKAMNAQLTNEFYSAYLYLSMAAYFEFEGLTGFSHWMKMQHQEEFLHVRKFFDFINDRGSKIELDAIKKPQSTFTSIEDVFNKTLEHEVGVTKKINDLYALARELNDNSCCVFLQWFINEQVEEEKVTNDVLSRLKYAGNEPAGILMVDKELGARAAPSLTPEA